MAPFHGAGSTASTKSLGVLGTHLIGLGKMKG